MKPEQKYIEVRRERLWDSTARNNRGAYRVGDYYMWIEGMRVRSKHPPFGIRAIPGGHKVRIPLGEPADAGVE